MTDSDAPTFDLPEPPHGKVEEFTAAGRKVGEWFGAKSTELVRKAERLGVLTEEWNDDLTQKIAGDLVATVNDLRTRGYPDRKVAAFEKSALSSCKKYMGRASKIEGLKG
jgi:hypothetical protein